MISVHRDTTAIKKGPWKSTARTDRDTLITEEPNVHKPCSSYVDITTVLSINNRPNRQYIISKQHFEELNENTRLDFHLCAKIESFCPAKHCSKALMRRYVCNRWEMCLNDTTRCLTTLNVSKCRTFNSFDKRTQSDLN